MIPINHVMIKIEHGDNYITMRDGTKLSVNISFDPHQHVASTGIIEAVPKRLLKNKYADGEYNPRGMEWDTEMDIEKGDRVYFQKLEALMALGRLADPVMPLYEERSSYLYDNGNLYIFIPYNALFSVNRKGTIIMLNGYCIVEPIEQEKKYQFHVPEAYKKNELSTGKVLLMGKPNKEYYGVDYQDSVDFNIGDIVLFRKYSNMLHKDILDKEVYKIQRRQIICKTKN